MNFDNLHELINRYEAKIDLLYGKEHYELFKWCAVKCWRDEWFKPADSFPNFVERFAVAKKEFSLLIDNSRMHPSTGIIKLWEKEPETVEHLFNDVLFADIHGDVNAAQQAMDRFLYEYEQLRQRHFPGNWSYKQDRHSASVFLVMNQPEFHYAYKSSEALTMAKYTDFGLQIGAGGSFSLENYYRMCDEIVEALKEHKSLLEKHFNKLTDKCYVDHSLHLLAFDLMYCCRTYGYYRGLVAPVTGKTIKKPAVKTATKEELEAAEAQRAARILALEQELSELEQKIGDYDELSLTGVQVYFPKYGTGVVTGQKDNKITVQFPGAEKTFVLDERYSARPSFENDKEIVAAFTEYGRMLEQINKIKRELGK